MLRSELLQEKHLLQAVLRKVRSSFVKAKESLVTEFEYLKAHMKHTKCSSVCALHVPEDTCATTPDRKGY